MNIPYQKNLIPVLLVFVTLQFFFIDIYLTDKTIVPAQIAESMAQSGKLYGTNLPCHQKGKKQNLQTWGEEPPVFHLVSVFFIKIGLEKLYYRLLPLLCFLIYAWGLFRLSKFLIPSFHENQKAFLLSLILFQPFLFIHATRFLPDNLSLAFLVWFFYFFHKGKKGWAFLLSVLATTTKALAIFPIFFTVVPYLLFSPKKFLGKRLAYSLALGASLIPTFLWFSYLKENQISNPFFLHEIGIQHTGGMDFGILLTRKYWSRILSWVVFKGTSLPLFVLSLYGLYHLWKKRGKTFLDRWILSYLIGHFFYVLIVRGQQFVSPWYSFYFFPCYFILIIEGFKHLRSFKIKMTVFILTLLTSFSLVDWRGQKIFTAYPEGLKEIPALACRYHE